jgi:hypothetical protein
VNPVTISRIEDQFATGVTPVRSTWSLLQGKSRALDVVNHVLRVIVQLNLAPAYEEEFAALAGAQHPDGAWADHSLGTRGGIRNTCFSARNLIRANRILHRGDFHDAAERAARYVVARQNPDGSWSDLNWGPRDATSSSMGLLLYTVKEDWGAATSEIHAAAFACLARAAAYLELTQSGDGSWSDTDDHEGTLGATAHLLPKLALYEGKQTPAVAAGVDLLVGSQEKDGSWDGGHTDHTCDAARALLLANSVIVDARLADVIERGVRWLAESANPDGLWGERPGEPSSLLIVCDVLDCFSKYEALRRSLNLRAFWE